MQEYMVQDILDLGDRLVRWKKAAEYIDIALERKYRRPRGGMSAEWQKEIAKLNQIEETIMNMILDKIAELPADQYEEN